MRIQKMKKYSTLLFAIILLIFVGLYLNSQKRSSTSTTSKASSLTSQSSQSSENGNIQLAFFNAKDEGGEIYLVNTNGKNLKKIYPNNLEKIISATSADNKNILALIQEGEGKNLYLLSIDGKTKKKIYDNYNFEQTPTISSDNKKVTVVNFSNADPNYGFTLNILDLDSNNKNFIYSNTSGILYPHFINNNYIIFVEQQNNEIKIMKVNINTKQSDIIASYKNEQIFSLSSCGQTIIYSKTLKNSAKSLEIYSINLDGSNFHQITKDNRSQNLPVCYQDGQFISYTLLNYPGGKISSPLVGDIMVKESDSDQRVGQGDYPISFVIGG